MYQVEILNIVTKLSVSDRHGISLNSIFMKGQNISNTSEGVEITRKFWSSADLLSDENLWIREKTLEDWFSDLIILIENGDIFDI